MHELSIVESIIKICEEEAEKYKVTKVKEIKIKVGELSEIMPDCIEYYFNIISSGTRIEGAKLIIQRVPVEVLCKKCGYIGSVKKKDYFCPSCSSYDLKIMKGNEFLIESLEVD